MITLEFLKFKVPLSQAWEDASKNLLGAHDRVFVEQEAFKHIVQLESRFTDDALDDQTDPKLVLAAREAAIASVQARFSGCLPELPEREADLLSQHTCLWSLISQLIKTSTGSFSLQMELLAHAKNALVSEAGSQWKQRAKNILNALGTFKGTTNEDIKNICLSDVFLCERELVIPAVKLITRGSDFKKIMSAPDMVSDGEQTLPKLLVKLGSDKEFRQAFVWLPLDPESPLNVSGGSGVMPTDGDDYRFVLGIILKILFGKLRQRGNGIDKRISFAERQGLIMSYIGTVPVSEMGIVFQVLLGRVVNEGIHMESLEPRWNGDEFVDACSGISVLNRKYLEEHSNVRIGILQSMNHVIGQMKRKIDAFVPLFAVFVVSTLAWDLTREDVKSKNPSKVALLRLAEMMEIYVQLGAKRWEPLLLPIVDVMNHHLTKSSAAEVSTVFRMITNWSHSEEMVGLLTCESIGRPLLEELFKPRALSGAPAASLFNMVLTLCGDAALPESASAQSYVQSRQQLIRDQKRTGGDMDSDSEDEAMVVAPKLDNSSDQAGLEVVVSHIPAILAIVSLSLAKSLDKSLPLRVTVTIARLASYRSIALPEDSCEKLLELIADQLKVVLGLPHRKARLASKETCMLLEASSQVSSLVPPSIIPPTLMATASRLVLSMDDVRGRILLSECLVELAKKTSVSDVKAAEKLVELNSVRQSGASLQPDVDTHVDVLQDILDLDKDNLRYYLSSVLMIRQCLFLLSSIACDTTVRHCAERFLAQTGLVRDDRDRLPIPRLVMIINQLHKLLDSHSSEATHRSALKLIVGFVRDYSHEVVDEENARLMHKDLLPFTKPLSSDGGPSVLEDLQHIQRHRRTRALGRLADASDQLTPYTKRKLLAPLAIEGIVQPEVAKSAFDSSLADTGIKALQVCPNLVDLLIKLMKVYLRKFEEREKVIYKTVSKVTEHLLLSNTSFPEDEVVRAQNVLVPLLRKRVFDSKGSLRGSTLVGDQSSKHRLARDKSGEADGVVRVEAVVALLEVLKFFCSSSLADQTEHLVRIILKGLPSRELVNRRAARDALRRCSKVLGIRRLAWLMKEIRHALPRGGFQAAVAVFTCFSVVECTVSESTLSDSGNWSTDFALEVLECLRIEDAQWAMTQSRTDGALEEEVEMSKQCIEAKRRKAHELLELSSKILPASTVTSVLLRSVYSQFNSIEGIEIDDSSSVDSDVDIDAPRGASSDDDSDDSGSEKKKRKKQTCFSTKISKANQIQMNAVHQSKKYLARIEAALVSVLQGIRDNAHYSSLDRIGLCVQSMAQFEDISSRKLRLSDESLFAKNGIHRQLLKMDDDIAEPVAKKQRVLGNDFRLKQKEKTFLVQPGASTGRGHWVTEEWKRGKIGSTSNGESKSVKHMGMMDLLAVKTRVLGSMGLRILNAIPTIDLGSLDEELKTGLAKFVSRAFCSGIAELFQPSAKAIQKLLFVDHRVFNEKAMSMIARRLMASMEQLHQSGSDLSFITLKQQRKSASAEVASTCSSLLLTLVSVDSTEEWLKPDMLETLVSHIRASLDKPALQLASLAVLRKLFFSGIKKFKSASLYDCLNTVGDLIVTATNPRVCGLCGTLYAQFLVDFPHTEKALTAKLLGLIKQSHSASFSVSRCTALNTIHSFARALPSKTLQDVYAEVIIVTLSVNVCVEEDAAAREMTHKILTTVLERFVDQAKRDRLIGIIAAWPSAMTRHQFVLGSAEVASVWAANGLLGSQSALDVVVSVIRQLPYLIVPETMDSTVLSVKSQKLIVEAVERLVMCSSTITTVDVTRVVEFVGVQLLKQSESDKVPVVVAILKFLLSVSSSLKSSEILIEIEEGAVESVKILDDQIVESLAPWPMLMRVLRVLTRDSTETHLEIPSLAMKTIASLLSLSEQSRAPIAFTKIEERFDASQPAGEQDDVDVEQSALGLFAHTPTKTDTREAQQFSVDSPTVSSSDRLVALLKKIRYEVRGLMAKPRESVIRLASLLKLTAALTLSAHSSENEDLLTTSLDILIRLATINKTAEEVSTEIGDVNSLFELSILRPIEQIGCLSKMANGAIESIEKHYKDHAAFFTRQLTATTATINRTRKDRKISLLNLAVSNPARHAMLRLQKSKRKTEKKQEKAKETVKRIKGLIN